MRRVLSSFLGLLIVAVLIGGPGPAAAQGSTMAQEANVCVPREAALAAGLIQESAAQPGRPTAPTPGGGERLPAECDTKCCAFCTCCANHGDQTCCNRCGTSCP